MKSGKISAGLTGAALLSLYVSSGQLPTEILKRLSSERHFASDENFRASLAQAHAHENVDETPYIYVAQWHN